MSTRYEGADATASVDWEKPGAEIGEDKLGPGTYALVIDYGEVFYIQGSAKDLRRFMVRLDEQLQQIEAHELGPVSFSDITVDEDGDYGCPRCETYFSPRDQEDLNALVLEVTRHIETHAPVVTSS
jgi:hypothetical protein